MSKSLAPSQCPLCGARDRICSAGFRQIYTQSHSEPVMLDWWECGICNGCFVHPIPSPDVVNRHLASVDYNNEATVVRIAKAKESLQRRILTGLANCVKPKELLDFGCNFGQFLVLAREAGWKAYGFDPYLPAAEVARSRGFEVCSHWSLEESDFAQRSFSAITAVDVFSFVWEPIKTLRTFNKLLKPGGMLVMRLTNKRFPLGIARGLSYPGPRRDRIISKILLGQFHSIGLKSLSRIMADIGFHPIKIETAALTAPWSQLGWQTRLAYAGSEIVYRLSRVNLSPGVLLFARRSSRSSTEYSVTTSTPNLAIPPKPNADQVIGSI